MYTLSCLLVVLRDVSMARACRASSREGSSFTSAARKGLESFGEGSAVLLHRESVSVCVCVASVCLWEHSTPK